MKTLIAILLSMTMLSGCAGFEAFSKNFKGHIELRYQELPSLPSYPLPLDSTLNMTEDSLYGSTLISNVQLVGDRTYTKIKTDKQKQQLEILIKQARAEQKSLNKWHKKYRNKK